MLIIVCNLIFKFGAVIDNRYLNYRYFILVLLSFENDSCKLNFEHWITLLSHYLQTAFVLLLSIFDIDFPYRFLVLNDRNKQKEYFQPPYCNPNFYHYVTLLRRLQIQLHFNFNMLGLDTNLLARDITKKIILFAKYYPNVLKYFY